MISTSLHPFSFCTTRQNDGWLMIKGAAARDRFRVNARRIAGCCPLRWGWRVPVATSHHPRLGLLSAASANISSANMLAANAT